MVDDDAAIGDRSSAAADDLLASLVAQPWGQLSPSAYETARVVSYLPWLAGHASRVRYLLAGQRPDGAWGGPDGYALVPTLSAVEALLTVLSRADPALSRADPAECPAICHEILVAAVDRGLGALWQLLHDPAGVTLPDTPAIEIIVPALVEAVNAHLVQLCDPARPGPANWRGVRLPQPPGVNPETVMLIRARLDAGAAVPAKFLHSLEAFGATGSVRPVAPGTIGASPAATAWWLARRPPATPADPARRYLEAVAAPHGGPVPSVVPVTAFERAWVLSELSRAAIAVPIPEPLVTGLAGDLSAAGAAGGAGLPVDADTTSVVLLNLRRFGRRPDLDCLWKYETNSHFCTWPGERTPSVTVNAHVLEAFGDHLEHHAASATGGSGALGRYGRAVARIVGWLSGQQHPDGAWTDKWHASPFYATACCALALHRYGGEAGAPAVGRAVDWVLSTQDGAGAWGRWGGTAEETAYALQILLIAGRPDKPAVVQAVTRGYRYLRAGAPCPDPPLWHDKDLYHPVAVVRAAVLAALHLARRRMLAS